MFTKIEKAIFVAYLAMALVTFGHAFNRSSPTYTGYAGETRYITYDLKAINSVLVAMLWPLYWSVQIWEKP